MSHQQFYRFNASPSQLVRAKDLFLEIVIVATLSTSVFALFDSINSRSVSATEVETAVEETTVEEIAISDLANPDSSPVNTSSADSSEPLEIGLSNDLTSLNCLVEAPWETQQFCLAGDSIELSPTDTLFTPQDFTFESGDRPTSFRLEPNVRLDFFEL